MPRKPPTPPTRTSPLIQQRTDGRFAICFDAAAPDGPAAPPKKKVKPEGTTYTVVGYRQTVEPAVRGGKPNSKGVRFRPAGMRAMARTFRGQPFITAHDWGDATKRGGTIADAWVEEVDGELLMLFELLVTKQWAIEGFEDATIDRFSIAADFLGEMTCTFHDAPVWSDPDCWCWPGMEIDGQVVEFEAEDGTGLELSTVNVAAVDDTYVVAMAADGPGIQGPPGIDVRLQSLHELGRRCGRHHPALAQLVAGGAPAGGFRASRPRPTMTAHEQPRGNEMDRALICKGLGLPETATDDEIKQRLGQLGADAAQAGVLRAQLEQSATDREAERDAAHVEATITSLRASHQVTDKVVAGLRGAVAPPGGRAAFDAAVELVRGSAPALPAPGTPAGPGAARVALQSDTKPAAAPGVTLDADGPDAFEANRENPSLPRFMKWGRVDEPAVRKHGSRQFNVVSNLGELAEATAKRG